jgi:cytochrome o ubiquinol oxidase subunit 2
MKIKRSYVFIGLSCLCAAVFFDGCSQMLLLDPKGPIGGAERFVIIAAFVLMLIVVLPVFVMVIWFARKYRASNPKATYQPKWSYSTKIDLAMWLVPLAIVIALGILSWRATFSLDPYKPIASGEKPINIEVVSLDWKWLFIYPDYHIAAVNQLVFPVKVPLNFRVTSDSVLTSFFIPQLGSQIYAMAGRQSRLHLMADEPGTYAGHNQQFSGRGYADMYFKAIAVSREQFEAWVQNTGRSPNTLDPARYEDLAKPSIGHPVTFYSSVTAGLFDRVIQSYGQAGATAGPTRRDSVIANMKTGDLEGR